MVLLAAFESSDSAKNEILCFAQNVCHAPSAAAYSKRTGELFAALFAHRLDQAQWGHGRNNRGELQTSRIKKRPVFSFAALAAARYHHMFKSSSLSKGSPFTAFTVSSKRTLPPSAIARWQFLRMLTQRSSSQS